MVLDSIDTETSSSQKDEEDDDDDRNDDIPLGHFGSLVVGPQLEEDVER